MGKAEVAGSVKHYSFETVYQIVLSARAEIASVAQICERYYITPRILSLWQKQYEGVQPYLLRLSNHLKQRIQILEEKLRKRDLKIEELESKLERLSSTVGGGRQETEWAEITAYVPQEH